MSLNKSFIVSAILWVLAFLSTVAILVTGAIYKGEWGVISYFAAFFIILVIDLAKESQFERLLKKRGEKITPSKKREIEEKSHSEAIIFCAIAFGVTLLILLVRYDSFPVSKWFLSIDGIIAFICATAGDGDEDPWDVFPP